MGIVGDLRYFAGALGPRRGAALLGRKLVKAWRKRRLAEELRHGEGDAALLARLALSADPARRAETLRDLWLPLAETDVGEGRVRALLAGRQELFGLEVAVGWPPRWDWRWDGLPQAEAFADDLRSTWELQRLQGLLPLAWAARRTPGEAGERAASAYLSALEDFYRVHPGPDGTAWESALEVGLRLVAFAQGLPLVAGTEALAASDLVVLRLLDRHARWLAADLSLDKVVRGNHLLGELAGLTVAGHLMPEGRGAWWRGLHPQRILEAEILRQFHPDGVSVEQSLSYEKFVLEFVVVAGDLAARRGRPFPPPVLDRLARAADHLEAVTAPDGLLPRVGDCDSGRGARWVPDDPHDPADLIVRLRRLTERPSPKVPPGRRAVHFPNGGHAVVSDPDRGAYLFLRGGPFGWGLPGPASHSHADWLAPVLYHRGEAILVDPGVYGYRVGSALRNAFRTWDAHSAVAFEPPRPPVPAGTFRWAVIPPEARLAVEERPDGAEASGTVSFGGSRNPLLWHRLVRYNQLDETWILTDRFTGDDPGPVTWAFHFAARVEVAAETSPGCVAVSLPSGSRYLLRFDPPGEIRVESGWVAPRYGERIQAPVLRRRLSNPTLDSKIILEPAARESHAGR